MKDRMLEYFEEVFGYLEGVKVYFAPGRVNLIGEHTDYNGGHVFPCALTLGTYAAVRKRKDRGLRFYSMNFRERGILYSSLDELNFQPEADWTNYPKAVIWAYLHSLEAIGVDYTEKMLDMSGLDIVYYGNIPNSSGLSSSASIEVLTAYILSELLDIDIDLTKLSLLCQFAENRFVGVNCGIMDQFAIARGRKNHAIFLDTANLQYEYAPIELDDAKLVIACSNKKRGLGDSKYNERRSECEEALARLKKVMDVNSLGDITIEEFETHKSIIGDSILIRRARHAVYENQRTMQAVDALKNGNIVRFGTLMNESHISLRDDYEVTGIELDTLVETAWKQEGVIGSRMTGAGFGGCTVSIVKNECIDSFLVEVGRAYEDRIGYPADFYIVEIGGGPREV